MQLLLIFGIFLSWMLCYECGDCDSDGHKPTAEDCNVLSKLREKVDFCHHGYGKSSCGIKHCRSDGATPYCYYPKVDGGWSVDVKQWGPWSATCGEFVKRSGRKTCTNPTPKYGGKDCSGDAETTDKKVMRPCGWKSSACDSGTAPKHKDCEVPLNLRKKVDFCQYSKKGPMCNVKHCRDYDSSKPYCYFPKVHGGWSVDRVWGSWSATCGVNHVKRSGRKTCTNPTPKYGGKTCIGDPRVTTVEKLVHPCGWDSTVDGGWSDAVSNWEPWQDGANYFDGADYFVERTGYRTCTNPAPKPSGKTCKGNARVIMVKKQFDYLPSEKELCYTEMRNYMLLSHKYSQDDNDDTRSYKAQFIRTDNYSDNYSCVGTLM